MASVTRAEIVVWPRLMQRPQHLLAACRRGLRRAGVVATETARPAPGAALSVTWGLGHPEGQALIARRRAHGGHVIGFDLGYWQRGNHFRVTIDHDHPQALVMRRPMPATRWERSGIKLRHDGDPAGHVLLIGTGHKTAATYNECVGAWECLTAARLVREHAGRRLVFRPKPGGKNDCVPPGFTLDTSPTIEAALSGCSLVVCRNSNVAVDAIIAGVPFHCEDGAAMAVRDMQPMPDALRLHFLAQLAWWQWTVDELERAETWDAILSNMETR